ncbi:uncharacterized protein LOC131076695 [Cryptomeria japonica]|uniref:uncharacterized protein LOC131076695 n=1 Tax=Cryptomeria japonica TaxID=3369 RepID=UPI0027DA83EC|nr:uncharacterized protein LOC131076695 [Cryptomeria japonica]
MLGFASMTCGVGRQAMRPLLNHGGSLEHGDNGAFRRSGLHLTKDSDISRPGCGVSEKSGIWDTARDAGLKINNPMNGNTPSDWVREGFFDSGVSQPMRTVVLGFCPIPSQIVTGRRRMSYKLL